VDFLRINDLAFPVLRGTLSRLRNESSDYCWNIEIHCGRSDQWDNPNTEVDEELEWLVGTEPYLYAQGLPLRVASPEELVRRRYDFPQTPDSPLEEGEPDQWSFFVLYLHEHDQVYPMALSFTEKRDRQYRVEIVGKYDANETSYDLRVEAWLDWKE
jgi:hypothetical protein